MPECDITLLALYLLIDNQRINNNINLQINLKYGKRN